MYGPLDARLARRTDGIVVVKEAGDGFPSEKGGAGKGANDRCAYPVPSLLSHRQSGGASVGV